MKTNVAMPRPSGPIGSRKSAYLARSGAGTFGDPTSKAVHHSPHTPPDLFILEPAVPGFLRRRAESARDSLGRRDARRRHAEEKRRFHDHIHRVLGTFAEDVDPGPPWTRELILRTSAADEDSVEELIDPDRFYASGYSMMRRYLEALEPYGFNLRTVRRPMRSDADRPG